MEQTIEQWYDALQQFTSERGQVGLPDMESLRHAFDQGYKIEEAYASIYPPAPSVYDYSTGVEPSHQVDATRDDMSSTELALAAEEDTAPHVTEAQVLAKVAAKTFTLLPAGRTILCEIVMQNGATFHGMSTPVSNDNLDLSQAQSRSLQKAIRKAWDAEGYLLREDLYRAEMEKVRARSVAIEDQSSS